MLTFRNTSIVFLLLLLLFAFLQTSVAVPVWVYIITCCAYLFILSYGSYFVHSGFFMPVICSGNTSGKKIALSFDDGPVPNRTSDILEVLDKYKVNAAFFCIGYRIEGNESIIRSIKEKGHVIGNHSFSHHYFFDFFSRARMQQDLAETDKLLKQAAGITPLFFRPPYGVTTPVMKKVMQVGNYTAVGWNIRSLDTVISDEQKLFNRITAAIKPGAIILLHDTGKATLHVLPRVIEYALENGYTFERLDRLINKQAYA